MQDFIVSVAAWIGPDLASPERRAVDDPASYEADEASLAQFEAMLPPGPGERIDRSERDGETCGIAATSGGGAAQAAAAGMRTAAMSQNEAGGRPKDERAAQSDAIVSSYTIHHARLGVVHVQQSNGNRGDAGAVTLRTDDDLLRARLLDAVPALRGALGDGHGHGPNVSVDT